MAATTLYVERDGQHLLIEDSKLLDYKKQGWSACPVGWAPAVRTHGVEPSASAFLPSYAMVYKGSETVRCDLEQVPTFLANGWLRHGEPVPEHAEAVLDGVSDGRDGQGSDQEHGDRKDGQHSGVHEDGEQRSEGQSAPNRRRRG